MASNTFNNVAIITQKAMDVLENNLVFTKFVNRQYDDQFRETGAKNGDTANIRIPGFYTVRNGQVANPQGYNDTFKPIVLSQKGVDLSFTTKELRLNVEDGDAFTTNVLNPMIAPLANQIDLDGLSLLSQINQATGTPGTAPTDLSSFLDGGAILDEAAVPRDGEWSAIMSPRTQSSIVNGLKTLFNPNDDIAEQYKNGTMGRLAAGFKFSIDQNIPTQTVGPLGGTPLVTSAPADGATTLVSKGWMAAAAPRLNVGDVFTVDGVNKVNPVSKADTGQLQQFVVTAAFSSDSSGNGSISVSPAFILTGPLQNITALPAANAAITPLSAASKVSPTNVVFHKDAFGLICVDLPKPDGIEVARVRSKKLNIALRMIKWYNGTQDTELYRLDVLYGWGILRPTFACRVQG
jgi:hypothetical protein